MLFSQAAGKHPLPLCTLASKHPALFLYGLVSKHPPPSVWVINILLFMYSMTLVQQIISRKIKFSLLSEIPA